MKPLVHIFWVHNSYYWSYTVYYVVCSSVAQFAIHLFMILEAFKTSEDFNEQVFKICLSVLLEIFILSNALKYIFGFECLRSLNFQ